MRQAVARTRLARLAALPGRARLVASHDVRTLGRSASWLVRSREHTNFTYPLTERNQQHLAWWVSHVTGADLDEIWAYMVELEADEVLRGHVQRATRQSTRRGLADRTVQYGRRAGWYALVRALRPVHVVETGTDKGLGSCVLAAALLRNGSGRLTTIDVNPDSGYLVTGRYADVVDLLVGDSLALLAADERPVQVFLHDSLHTYEHESAELAAVEPRLLPRAVVLSDNAHATDALMHWAVRSGRRFLFFRETPENHWYPGSGVGAAWACGVGGSRPERP